jgi:hypothetical protein
MPRFKDGYKTSPLAIPTYWEDPANHHKIYWQPTQYWLGFMETINAYTDGNGKERVAESEVEAQICTQLPPWVCDGEGARSFPESPHSAKLSSLGGCCGRRS